MNTVTGPKIVNGQPVDTAKERSFLLIYRYVNNVGSAKGDPLNLMFWFKGDLANARLRARQHCEKMNYRFISCRPFIVDLDEREKLRSHDTEDSDD